MFKNVFVAAAILIASPALVSAQHIFWSFSRTELATTSSGELGQTGSAYIFSDLFFGFSAIDLDFTTSAPCVRFTGGEAFNPEVFGGSLFESITVTIDAEGSSGNLFAVNVLPPFGTCPPTADCVAEYFVGVENVGPNGAFLLARVDFEIVGSVNDIELEFALGDQGAIELPNLQLDPSFGSATLELELFDVLFGDINLDGQVNFFDIQPFISVLSSGSFQLEADLNQDCEVNFFDISFFITFLGS